MPIIRLSVADERVVFLAKRQVDRYPPQMKTIQVPDGQGESLTVIEDAGLYIAMNILTDNLMSLGNFQARSDDILIVTYPKSGTHWMQAITNLMVQNVDCLAGSGEYQKNFYHLEYTPLEIINNAPSPRVICTHLPLERISLDFLRMKSKIVVCVRNPRDVAVSYFRFCANLKDIGYRGSFNGFFNLFIHGSLPYNSWFDHVFSWLKAARSGRHDIHVVRYEDLQQVSQ
ncbi:sulfotransferase [Elysia marginata]|uniref:Sulfotransferase n=1 Tax=Elysia marginata TaxID=1093978 RepID=A0AAV4EK60_9GAST|nr:sulfotransferase [Elysia marginata]